MNNSAQNPSSCQALAPSFTLESRETLRDGTTIWVRPIRPSDIDLEREFIERLSPRSRRYRFLGTIKSPSTELLRKLTEPELARGVAYIALIKNGAEQREVGVCRYSADPDGRSCECAVAVSDEWQRKGIATLLMGRLIRTARGQGIKVMYSRDAHDNEDMRELAEHLGFHRTVDPDDPTLVIHALDLSAQVK